MNVIQPGHDPGALRPVLEWVDDRFGPIRRLGCTLKRSPEPRWWVYTAALSRCPPGTFYQEEIPTAAGASVDPSEALRRVLGEAVERYCGLLPPTDSALFEMPLGDGPLWHRFHRCASDEPTRESFRHPPAKAAIRHTAVRRLSDDSAVPIPATYVYQVLSAHPHEPPLTIPISTGLAFHTHLVEAIWRGLCEVAERDAAMMAWWTGRAKRLFLGDVPLPEPLADRLECLRSAQVVAHLFDIAGDFKAPTILAVLEGQRFPYYIVGASCHSNPSQACAKAIDEAIGVRHFVSSAQPSSASRYDDFGSVRSLSDHAVLYARWRGSPAFRFLFDTSTATSFRAFADRQWWRAPTTHAELQDRASILETMGLTPLWADLTSPEAKGFGHVVRVVVPEMVPLSPDHRARWLATPRLASALASGSQNLPTPFPHPLA